MEIPTVSEWLSSQDEQSEDRWLSRRERKAGRREADSCELCCNDNGERTLCFDHCHTTGTFRGWLCSHRNSALGFARDDPALLRRMAEYLESHQRRIDESQPKR